jgi:hypothetical protein
MYHPLFKKLLVGLFLAVLTGCATTEIVRDTPPPELLRDCPLPLVDIRTNGGLAQGLLSYHDALIRCNIDKQALREWAQKD